MPRAVASVRVPRRDAQPLARRLLVVCAFAVVQEHAGTFHLDLQVSSYIISCIMSTCNETDRGTRVGKARSPTTLESFPVPAPDRESRSQAA